MDAPTLTENRIDFGTKVGLILYTVWGSLKNTPKGVPKMSPKKRNKLIGPGNHLEHPAGFWDYFYYYHSFSRARHTEHMDRLRGAKTTRMPDVPCDFLRSPYAMKPHDPSANLRL